MSRPIILFSLAFTIAFITSCSDKKEPIGKWDDCIVLSKKNIEFSVKPDSVIITTQGDWWWVDGISMNDSTYHYYNNEDINLESDYYSIKEDCFVVERRDKNTLFIKMNENITGEERLMIIVLEAGDYFDYIHINQLSR